MGLYSANGFYELTQVGSSSFFQATGPDLAVAVDITESSDNFENAEVCTATFLGWSGTGAAPATLTYRGLYNNDSKYLVFSSGSTMYLVTNQGTITPAQANIANNPTPVCFLAGTRIAVPDGFALIEGLRVGDLVLTASGVKPLKFLARTTSCITSLRTAGRMPICVSAGAFGEAGPSHDLWLSPSHAVKLADCLVEAGALCNGGSVHQPEGLGSMMVDYYNLEFEDHEIIYANDLAVESYYANWRGEGQSRASWDNYADYVALYGEGGQMQEQDLPRIPFARQLPVAVRELIGTTPKELVTA
jgi:hypothetical protein